VLLPKYAFAGAQGAHRLYAANGTTIHIYELISRSMNVGIRRDLTWCFVVMNVDISIIGVVLLSYYRLLVDCRKKRLLHAVISVYTTGLITPLSVPSVKFISGGTPTDSLLEKFPRLSKP